MGLLWTSGLWAASLRVHAAITPRCFALHLEHLKADLIADPYEHSLS